MTRIIEIEKSTEPLGIRIIRGDRGGIIVHTVTPGSLAARAELQYGDQILEVSVWCINAANSNNNNNCISLAPNTSNRKSLSASRSKKNKNASTLPTMPQISHNFFFFIL